MSLFFSPYTDDYWKKNNIDDSSSFVKKDLIFTRCYPKKKKKNCFGRKLILLILFWIFKMKKTYRFTTRTSCVSLPMSITVILLAVTDEREGRRCNRLVEFFEAIFTFTVCQTFIYECNKWIVNIFLKGFFFL